MYSLYLITNLINRKRYAGITSRSIYDRFVQHCTQGNSLTNAIRKYGRDNFTLELISSSNALDRIKNYEVRLIKSLRLTNRRYGYNLSDGGDLTAKTESTKRKISKKLKGKPKSESHRKKIQENAVKMGLKRKGKPRPKFSNEWKKNMSSSKLGVKLTAEHKAKIAQGIRSSEKYAKADKGKYFRNSNPQYNPILKSKIARAKYKPIYCVNNGVSYLSSKDAAAHLGLNTNSIATAINRSTTIHGLKFYLIYK